MDREDEPDEPLVRRLSFVDDEPSIRPSSRRTLENQGDSVLEAENGEEAIALMNERGHEVSAIVVDQAMPGLNGHETLLAIRKSFPEVPALVGRGKYVRHVRLFTAKDVEPKALLAWVRQVAG